MGRNTGRAVTNGSTTTNSASREGAGDHARQDVKGAKAKIALAVSRDRNMKSGYRGLWTLKFCFASDNLPAMTLTEMQQLAIIHATGPLLRAERTALLAELGTLLAGRSEIGDGELGRMLRDLQRKHFRPPK